ncbi:MAG: hypothetical protein Q7S58_12465 [Candidatus Binatus sp.]|uniref:rhodanese-like domain-containing protein n=1 Tax=Candidatus Binatus sp. TaxID=2811406 RepID=UPI00271E9890|nr:hypothetical protein [Candidatus Binatus sp.]MDO8433212.1 hypothetical protein [Candidatus Binatus sp.]
MASHEAARRATDAGYMNVSVMADGIFGWKNAGQPLEVASTLTPIDKNSAPPSTDKDQ